jgi:hypothetical protein
MANSLENQFIDQSYQKVVQVSGSFIADGTGSVITNLNVTASHVSGAQDWNGQFTGSATISGSLRVTGSYGITGTQLYFGEVEQYAGNFTNYVGGNIQTFGGKVAGNTMGFANGTSTLTGSFSGDGSGLTNITAAPSPSASYAVSASHANFANSSQTSVTATTATSASHAVQADSALTSTTAISSSHALQADSAISSQTSISASHAVNADAVGLFTKTVTDGTEFQVLRTDGAGNLSFDWADRAQIETRTDEAVTKGDPLYVTGFNVGENRITVGKADASNSAKMPVYGLAYETVANNVNTQMVAIGSLNDVNTRVAPNDFQEGDTLYVKAGGGLTNVKQTGTNLVQNVGIVGRRNQNNGEIIASAIGRSNDLPNIAEGNIWAGNASGVPTATSTGSFAKIDKNNTFTGTQTFNNISVNGTGSFAYIQSVTGSAKTIGDAFIILNNDTPVERYAGLVVQDSGSGSPLTTSSFQYDGQTDDWFYEYSDDGGVTTDHGITLFGPEYNVKGTPTYPTNNIIQKGDGGHHLLDSSITDTGVLVTVANPLTVTGTISGNLTGNVTGNASTATSASHALVADTAGTATTATSASHALVADTAGTATTATSASYAPTNLADANIWTAKNTFNSQVIGGVTSLTIASTTSSMDFQNGNFFNLTLANGVDTHLDVTNVTAGQTITLIVTNNATGAGTISFSPDFKFAGGTAPTVTATTNAVDILTFVTTDATSVYGTSILNFS